ncbi:CTSL [Lepeophtheirus salmonis]|uniref:CTSL n=2 Tax=Lepeophtheirus salmonis TaxID=72036 RepID=A0A7R8D3K9_LEPSM|nr:CTSL [Lepeophtheirus salmonis]CAF3017805.1 CTSL [Lepeophtheirus salmonis]
MDSYYKSALILVTILSLSWANEFFDLLFQEWSEWKLTHGKTYLDSTEERWRFKIYRENRAKIVKHNIGAHKGHHSYFLEMNHFGDLFSHEFTAAVNGYNSTSKQRIPGATFIPPSNTNLPDQMDWREKGAVTPVKDQGQCGSCWSFSATGALEGQEFRKSGKLISMSEQNLIDCSKSYGNGGCNGGLMDMAFRYVRDFGIDSETFYPYEAVDDDCRFNKTQEVTTDHGYVDVKSGSESDLVKAIATIGPISVAIDASHESLQFYSHGIYDERECSSTELDHGVLAVGYGADENGKKYYIVKNSWSEKMGE